MKLLALALSFLAAVSFLFARPKPPVLIPGLGQHHHTISTKSREAQNFFDQGLTLVLAFNHEEAARSFQRASELDPQSAMAFWGIALANGPCINLGVDPPHEKAAYAAVHKALLLAPRATQRERAYIQALATRYSPDPKVDLRRLDEQYAKTMRELSKQYPDDLDAATLYAESLMDLHPWKLWSLDGCPTEGTDEIIAVLESVLRRDPYHLGANHYYIHAQIITTSMPQKRLRIPSGHLRVRGGWRASHQLPVIWCTCPRTPICGWETTLQQPAVICPGLTPTAYICGRAGQKAACTT